MADVFLLIVRLLSFYMILYRSVFVNPLTVRTIDGADVSLQFHHHIVRSTGDLHSNFTVCFIDCNRAILWAMFALSQACFHHGSHYCGLGCRWCPGHSAQGPPMQRGPS